MITLETLAQRVTDIEPPRRFDPFSRRLPREELFLLHEKWTPLLGLEACEKSHIRYLHHRLINIETLCAGRMAGDAREAVLRMLVATAVKSDAFRMLEIGTLFGVNAAATWDVAVTSFGQASLTIVDPLEGYYGAGRRDPATGLPITRRTVELNLARLGVTGSDVEIIQAMSQEPSALSRAGEKSYNYMFIDGDHSAEGVIRDWHNYGPMLEAGGYVIFDNYNDPNWPEVEDAVDEIARDKSIKRVGVEWHTIVFRKI